MATKDIKSEESTRDLTAADRAAMEILETIARQQPPSLDGSTISTISDGNLYRVFRALAGRSKDYQDRLWGLLPEIRRRGLYRRFGYSSIEEFAQRMCRMKRGTIREFFRVYAKVEPCPLCNELFVSAKVGWTKFQAIAGELDPSKDAHWARFVQVLNKVSLRELCGNWQRQESGEESDPSALQPVNTYSDLRFHSTDAEDFHRYVKHRRRVTGRHHSHSEVLRHLIELAAKEIRVEAKTASKANAALFGYNRVVHDDPLSQRLFRITHAGHVAALEDEGTGGQETADEIHLSSAFAQAKEAAAAYVVRMEKRKRGSGYGVKAPAEERKASRNIPKAVREFHELRSGGYCTVGGCNRRVDALHHLERFSENPVPEPDLLVPLCRIHHDLVHTGAIANEDDPAEIWRCCLKPKVVSAKDVARAGVDGKVQGFHHSSRLERDKDHSSRSRKKRWQESRSSARECSDPRAP